MRRAAWLSIMALAVLVVSNSCAVTKAVVAPVDWRESVSHGELRIEWPRGKLHDNGERFMGLPVHDCWEFYNVGKHTEWADCMGVGYK